MSLEKGFNISPEENLDILSEDPVPERRFDPSSLNSDIPGMKQAIRDALDNDKEDKKENPNT